MNDITPRGNAFVHLIWAVAAVCLFALHTCSPTILPVVSSPLIYEPSVEQPEA